MSHSKQPLPSLDDVAFLERALALESVFDKLRAAKALIDEARALAGPALARLEASKARRAGPRKAPLTVNYGVDLPPDLHVEEHAVLKRLRVKGPLRKKAISEGTGMSWARTGAVLNALKKRGLVRANGATNNRTWETS